jgi:hypothetical protein
MNENEKFAAIMATLRAVLVDLGAIKASLATRDNPPTGRLNESTRISTFVYSIELRVRSTTQSHPYHLADPMCVGNW